MPSDFDKTDVSTGAKTRTTVRIRSDLLDFARSAGINLSLTLEQSLQQLRIARQRRQWLEENAAAFEDYNRRIERDGPFGTEFRRF